MGRAPSWRHVILFILLGACGVTVWRQSSTIPVERGMEAVPDENFTYPTAVILLRKELGRAFDSGIFLSEYFPVVNVVYDKKTVCNKTWEEAQRMAITVNHKMNEHLQEVGFVKFFQEYPFAHVRGKQHFSPDDAGLYFLPYCFYTQHSHVKDTSIVKGSDKQNKQSERRRRKRKNDEKILAELASKLDDTPSWAMPTPLNETWQEGWNKAKVALSSGRVEQMVEDLLKVVSSDKVFYVNSHPLSNPAREAALRQARGLVVDKTAGGTTKDLTIPQSVKQSLCPIQVSSAKRDRLLFLSGDNKVNFSYAGLRGRLADAVNALNKQIDVDASNQRMADEYDRGFGRAKFCTVIPGDTMSTSQAARAICAQCVPVYIIDEFRDLPFANILNYSTFSVRREIHDVIKSGGVKSLYQDLKQLIASGEYLRLYKNVGIAREFFNYHIFGPKSPYGILLLSIQEDLRSNDI